jgi:hypothetical protein
MTPVHFSNLKIVHLKVFASVVAERMALKPNINKQICEINFKTANKLNEASESAKVLHLPAIFLSNGKTIK